MIIGTKLTEKSNLGETVVSVFENIFSLSDESNYQLQILSTSGEVLYDTGEITSKQLDITERIGQNGVEYGQEYTVRGRRIIDGTPSQWSEIVDYSPLYKPPRYAYSGVVENPATYQNGEQFKKMFSLTPDYAHEVLVLREEALLYLSKSNKAGRLKFTWKHSVNSASSNTYSNRLYVYRDGAVVAATSQLNKELNIVHQEELDFGFNLLPNSLIEVKTIVYGGWTVFNAFENVRLEAT